MTGAMADEKNKSGAVRVEDYEVCRFTPWLCAIWKSESLFSLCLYTCFVFSQRKGLCRQRSTLRLWNLLATSFRSSFQQPNSTGSHWVSWLVRYVSCRRMHWASRFAVYLSLPYVSAASEVVFILQVHSSCPPLQSLPPRPFPKIPSKLFQDLSLEGSLWLIVTKCHEAMGARGLKRVDFTNPLHRAQASALTQLRQEAVGVSRLAGAAC